MENQVSVRDILFGVINFFRNQVRLLFYFLILVVIACILS